MSAPEVVLVLKGGHQIACAKTEITGPVEGLYYIQKPGHITIVPLSSISYLDRRVTEADDLK